MTRRLCLLLVCALAAASLASGCGGSSSTESGTSAVVDAAKRNAASAYKDCQKAASNSALTATIKAGVEKTCADIKSGNASALRADGVLVCQEEAAAQPASTRKALLKSCTATIK